MILYLIHLLLLTLAFQSQYQYIQCAPLRTNITALHDNLDRPVAHSNLLARDEKGNVIKMVHKSGERVADVVSTKHGKNDVPPDKLVADAHGAAVAEHAAAAGIAAADHIAAAHDSTAHHVAAAHDGAAQDADADGHHAAAAADNEEERMNADEPKEEEHVNNNVLESVNVKHIDPKKSHHVIESDNIRDDDKKPGHAERKPKKSNQIEHDSGLHERLSLDELQPPDHVDGLRVEHDGHLNRDYKKEILLGEEHGEFEDEPGRNQKLHSRLIIIFNKADTNHDGYLIKGELEAWIMEKVEEHLREAARENNRIFKHLDTDKDGYVTWKEFQTHFLLAQGHNRNNVEKNSEDYDAMKLEATDREKIVRYKFKWAEADQEPQDDRLNREEMKNFRHPEQSPRLLTRMAKDIIENLDQNEDGIISEEEFVSIPRHEDRMHEGGTEGEDLNIMKERRKEFRNVIDLNHDGKVTEDELKVYVDPHNAQHAELEADNLIQLADENHDNKLSIEEVLNNAELFFGSKIINVGFNFHDEF